MIADQMKYIATRLSLLLLEDGSAHYCQTV